MLHSKNIYKITNVLIREAALTPGIIQEQWLIMLPVYA